MAKGLSLLLTVLCTLSFLLGQKTKNKFPSMINEANWYSQTIEKINPNSFKNENNPKFNLLFDIEFFPNEQNVDKTLQNMGFKKSQISKSELTKILRILQQKESAEAPLGTGCIHIYNNILTFIKNDKVESIAKLDFDCENGRLKYENSVYKLNSKQIAELEKYKLK